jgi:hypothetical protein
MLDSPFEFCAVCREYVLLDQTQRECAREHRCTDLADCPLRRFFDGIEFGHPQPASKSSARRETKRPR